MITLGLNLGGPENQNWPILDAWKKLAQSVARLAGEPKTWRKHVPGVNVVYFVPGSVIRHETVQETRVARFSRKEKLIITNVLVPSAIARVYDEAFVLLVKELLKSVDLASMVFHEKGVHGFDGEAAKRIVFAAAIEVADSSGDPKLRAQVEHLI